MSVPIQMFIGVKMSGYNVSHNGQTPYGYEYDILNAERKRLYLEEQRKEEKGENGSIQNEARISEISNKMEEIKNNYNKNNTSKVGGRRHKCRKTKKSKKCKRRKTNRRR